MCNRLKPNSLFPLLLLLGVLHSLFSEAQNTTDHFGKNRIQTKRFDWTYYKTDNFEIYFYKEGSEIARFAALHAEEEYKRISKMIGYAPFGKTKLLLYNSHSDLLQSNIGLDDETAFVGGQTNFMKLNAEIAFNGNLIDFKNDINTSIARIYITDLLYGGNIREVYQNSLLMNLPEWFIAGAAAYVGRGWNQEMDDYMRDAVFKYRLRNPAKFRGKEAEILGQSIFSFITEQYGESQMANIITYARMLRNDREAIEGTLEMTYRDFLKEWRKYYKDMALETGKEYKMPSKEARAKKYNVRNVDYYKVKLSPNGNYVAYTQNLKGRYAVKLVKIKREQPKSSITEPSDRAIAPFKLSDIDKEMGIEEDTLLGKEQGEATDRPSEQPKVSFSRKKTINRGGNNLVNQKVNFNIPLIAWKNNNHIAVMVKKNNHHILKTYNANGILKSRTKIYNFNQILDFNYSADDNLIVLSAERNGQSDLFEYDTRRAKTRVITNDMYDDLNPAYVRGSKNIVWSSNRHNDTLGVDAGRFRLLGTNLDLFLYEPEKSATVLKRITNTIDNETKPVVYDAHTILCLSDKTGILNVNKLDLADTLHKGLQITNNVGSFRDYDVNASANGITYVTVNMGKERVFFEPLELNQTFETTKTARKERMEEQHRMEVARVEQNRKQAIQVAEEKIRAEQENAKLDNLVNAIMSGTMSDSAINKLAQDTTVNVLNLDTVQTETFVFESEKNTLKASAGLFNKKTGIKTDKYYLYKSDYQVFAAKGGLWKSRHRLGVENTVSTIVFDPLRGFGVVMNATLTDMFNDHRFYGGLFGSSDLRTSTVYLEYQYLKKRIDYRFRYEKQRLYLFNQTTFFPTKYTLNRWELEVAYPFTNTFRVSFAPYYMNSRFNLAFPLNTGTTPDPFDAFTHYGSYRAEAVYDNTLVTGQNMQEGTKFRLSYEFNHAFQQTKGTFGKTPQMDFGRLGLDFRRYQRLHQELILASRVSGGAFIGASPKNFLMGGMDNWASGYAVNTNDPVSPLYNDIFLDKRDLLFNKYVTTMRGFYFNQLYGNRYLLLNAEVRWPIVKYFYRGVIGSNFFKNLQLTAFYDVGTAWTGLSPWDKDNNFNTTIFGAGNPLFSAKVINYRNPWLQGFGPGIRTLFLGYYMKVDMAWGILDYVVQRPVWHVTLGYDF